MIKYSENILVRSNTLGKIEVLQCKDGCDYRETLDLRIGENIRFCVETDKFLPILSEGIVSITQEPTKVLIKTGIGEYRLPILKERGVFLIEPEVILPDTNPAKIWEFDFKGKSINTKLANNLTGSANKIVCLGVDYLARTVAYILEKYGNSTSSVFGITPPQYSLVSKLGKVQISYYDSGEASFNSGDLEVRVKNTIKPPDFTSLEKSLEANPFINEIDLSEIKVKNLGKFSLEKLYLSFNNGKVSFIATSARKTFEVPGLVVPEPLTLEILSNDLSYVFGKISIYRYNTKGLETYVVKSTDKEKSTYLMLKPYRGSLDW